jgi:hypothetical protein
MAVRASSAEREARAVVEFEPATSVP